MLNSEVQLIRPTSGPTKSSVNIQSVLIARPINLIKLSIWDQKQLGGLNRGPVIISNGLNRGPVTISNGLNRGPVTISNGLNRGPVTISYGLNGIT